MGQHMDQAEYGSIYKWLLGVGNDPVGKRTGTIGGQASAPRSESIRNSQPHREYTRSAAENRSLKIVSSLKRPCSAVEKSPIPSEILEPQEIPAPFKKRKDGYERKPRRKTRTDRYEHKTGRSKEGKQSSKKKTVKRSKRSRKDTLNENFHASNVAQNRLTLYSCPNMGIFQKEKSSSPVKPSELPDLSFSEMNFLCRRPYPPACNGSNSKMEEMHNEGPHLQKQKLSDFLNAPNTQHTASPIRTSNDNKYSPYLVDPIQTGSSVRSGHLYFAKGPNTGSTERALQDFPLHAKQDSASEVQEGEGNPSSATPYSWSISEQQEPSVDPSFECYVNSLVLAGLDTSGQRAEDKQTKKYWDLDELKRLLEERKRLWDPASRDLSVTGNSSLRTRENRRSSGQREMEMALFQHANGPLVTERDAEETPDTRCEISKCDDNTDSRNCSLPFIPRNPVVDLSIIDQQRNGLPEDSFMPANVEREPCSGYAFDNFITPFCPEILRHWDSSQETHSANPVCSNHFTQDATYNGETEVENSHLRPQTKMARPFSLPYSDAAKPRFEDEGLFLQVLDAAYNDIVHPENSVCEPQSNSATGTSHENIDGTVSTGLIRKSHLTVPTIRSPNDHKAASDLRECAQSLEQSAYSLSPSIYKGGSLLGWGGIDLTRLQAPVAASRPSFTDNFRAMDISALEQRRREPDRNTATIGLNSTPCEVPPGFWRQNRLY